MPSLAKVHPSGQALTLIAKKYDLPEEVEKNIMDRVFSNKLLESPMRYRNFRAHSCSSSSAPADAARSWKFLKGRNCSRLLESDISRTAKACIGRRQMQSNIPCSEDEGPESGYFWRGHSVFERMAVKVDGLAPLHACRHGHGVFIQPYD